MKKIIGYKEVKDSKGRAVFRPIFEDQGPVENPGVRYLPWFRGGDLFQGKQSSHFPLEGAEPTINAEVLS